MIQLTSVYLKFQTLPSATQEVLGKWFVVLEGFVLLSYYWYVGGVSYDQQYSRDLESCTASWE